MTGNGNMVIKCPTKQEVEELKRAAENALENRYEITTTKMMKPKVKIPGYEGSKPMEDIEECIRKQNNWILESDELRITYVKKKRNSAATILAECSASLFHKFMEQYTGSFRKSTSDGNKQEKGGIVRFDKRVGALHYANLKQKDEFMRASALAHIQKFPKMESLFCRKWTSKEYLHPDLNVKQMFNLYQEESLEQPKCSYHTYPRVFESLNLSFHHSRKDQCSLCLSDREGDANQKLELQDAYTANVAEKNTVCKKKEDAKEMSKNNPASIAAAVFDMQQVIQLP
ncbi:unnamed protein product [Ceutorhynchus assimilis]|uniref:Uncharacterized protein n=1 Tax=Ceutorhynchus assimilis TaxID=467358 RepID=A0A9N9QN13_9CUCU|nr:unnamed protein product [Ceutorhynchus assimilis]